MMLSGVDSELPLRGNSESSLPQIGENFLEFIQQAEIPVFFYSRLLFQLNINMSSFATAVKDDKVSVKHGDAHPLKDREPKVPAAHKIDHPAGHKDADEHDAHKHEHASQHSKSHGDVSSGNPHKGANPKMHTH
jgi:hypothetical protein